jgi:GNAT superfamily N-acetyltransferase
MRNGVLHIVIEVHSATPGDVDSIWRIIRTSFVDPSSKYTAVGQPGYRFFLRDFVRETTKRPKAIHVAKVDDRVCAFADATQRRDAPCFLTRIAVDPDFRGKSLASQLMSQVSTLPGYRDKWELDVFESNHKALKFYESRGFTTLHTKTWIGRHMPPYTEKGPKFVDAQFERYGFTEVEVDDVRIPIAGNVARIPTLNDLADSAYLQRLAKLFPHLKTV